MSGFTSEALEKKLVDLNCSQQSIQTLSLWLIHHRKHHKAIVQTWAKELKKARNNGKKLTFVYLANDVIQNSRKKGPEFAQEFAVVLKSAFENVARTADDKTWSGLNRVLSVWLERSIYNNDQVTELRSAIGSRNVSDAQKPEKTKPPKTAHKSSSSSQKPSKASSGQSKQSKSRQERTERSAEIKNSNSKRAREPEKEKEKPEIKRSKTPSSNPSLIVGESDKILTGKSIPIMSKITPKVPTPEKVNADTPTNMNGDSIVDPDILIKALQDLENSASSDATVREKIASLAPEVSDASLLDKLQDKGSAEVLSKQVDEACTILSDYNSRLAQELEDRRNISNMLSSYIKNQRDLLVTAEQRLGEYKEKMRKVIQVRNELKSHLQNLPDLSLLPSVTGGLAPLPSAGDLFSIAAARAAASSKLSMGSTSSASPNTASPADYETVSTGTPNSGTEEPFLMRAERV